MNTQVNIRLPADLRRKAERYAKRHGFENLQDLARETLRERIMEEESMKETLEIMRDKKLYRSILRSMKDVNAGRWYTWEELQESWKKSHGKK